MESMIEGLTLLTIFVFLPMFIIWTNLVRLLSAFKIIGHQVSKERSNLVDFISTVIIPFIFFTCIYGMRKYTEPIVLGADLSELHIPIAHAHYLTVMTLLAFSIASLWILKSFSRSLSPILYVLFTSGLVMGIILNIIFFIQSAINLKDPISIYLVVLVFINLIVEFLIGLKTGLDEFIKREELAKKEYTNVLLAKIYSLLIKGKSLYPIIFMMVIPVFIVIQCILILFGQQPDSIIKAFVETSDWTFSKRQSPQPIHADGHYLCTVTLRGHKKLVKPVRYGLRHDHVIMVNRQLLIANAFENILEEYVPRIHKLIRGFYDKYGLPIAKCINSPWAADVTYIIMKPLEWIFILCLYIVDKNPENRIAVQYLPKKD